MTKQFSGFIDDMGSFGKIICRDKPMETAEEEFLWHLNKMREHDGLRPISEIPDGIEVEILED